MGREYWVGDYGVQTRYKGCVVGISEGSYRIQLGCRGFNADVVGY